MEDLDHLKAEIVQREAELAELRARLAHAESQRAPQGATATWTWPLGEHEYSRYGRQMIVPRFGLDAQLRLRKARVLLVGAGGLGCPAAAYLAGAGVGLLGLVDGDEVEVSNLHRQIAHATDRVGMSKVESAITYLKGLNPSITYQAHKTHLTPQNAEQIVAQYDVVLDCTDRPASRYLVSDICVLLGKPLVSAAAFQTHGQLIVLNSPPGKGPCYRCIVPKPPPPDSVVGCGEGGIVGPVVGVMGVLQALEAIKLIANVGPSQQGSDDDDGDASHRCPTMLVFSALKSAPFTSARMRGRKPGCFGCSGELTLSQLASSMDYVQFCGVQKPVQQLGTEERVAPEAFRDMADSGTEHVLLDVRGEEHFSLASIPGSFNVPVGRITSHRGGQGTLPDGVSAALQQRPQSPRRPLFVVCREGNDSQLAVAKLKELGLSARDISGGLRAWKNTVDASFPFL